MLARIIEGASLPSSLYNVLALRQETLIAVQTSRAMFWLLYFPWQVRPKNHVAVKHSEVFWRHLFRSFG